MTPSSRSKSPGAALLRHQPALQAVGEAADGGLEMRQLLVEIGAQAIELGDVAEFLGLHRLVELHREGVVVDHRRHVDHGVSARRASPASRASVISEVVDDLLGFRLAGLAFAGVGLLGGGIDVSALDES